MNDGKKIAIKGNIPNIDRADSGWLSGGNMRDGFRWGRAKKEFVSQPKTSKSSKEQKRQKKARKLQRKLKKQRS